MIREHTDGSVSLDILVQPRASRVKIGPVHGDRLKVAVTSPPVDGAANQAVIDLFARTLRVPKRSVVVSAGASSRQKTLHIQGATSSAVRGLCG